MREGKPPKRMLHSRKQDWCTACISACTNLLRCERHKAEVLAAVEVLVLWKVDVHHLRAGHQLLQGPPIPLEPLLGSEMSLIALADAQGHSFSLTPTSQDFHTASMTHVLRNLW